MQLVLSTAIIMKRGKNRSVRRRFNNADPVLKLVSLDIYSRAFQGELVDIWIPAASRRRNIRDTCSNKGPIWTDLVEKKRVDG